MHVTSGLILRTNACIMETEYASNSSIDEAEELNMPRLLLPNQFKPPVSSCLDNTADCSFSSDTNDEDTAINKLRVPDVNIW